MTTLNDKIEDFYTVRDAYEAAKAVSDQLYQEKQRAENELIDAMLEEGTRSIKRDDGTTVSLRKAFNISVTKENYHQIREWLIDWIGDDTDFVEEVVSKPALTEKLKPLIEAGQLDEHDVPAFLNLSTRPGVSVLGWSKRMRTD